MLLLLFLVMLAAAAFGVFRFFQLYIGPAQRVAELEAENAKLHADLTKARLQSEMDAATRTELESQLSTLNAEMRGVREELSLFKRSQPKRR